MGYESEHEHDQVLLETGRWGYAGAGAILFSPVRCKFGFGLRSADVLEPGTIGTIGGAIDSGYTALETVENELCEEIGYVMQFTAKKINTFKDKEFSYENFLVIIDDKYFEPVLNWEVDEILWYSMDELLELHTEKGPLHFGVTSILNDQKSVEMLRAIEKSALSKTIEKENESQLQM